MTSLSARIWTLAATTALSLTLAVTDARADDTLDTVLFTGIDGYDGGAGIYGGFVTALNGDITASGWTLSANLGYSQSWGSFSDTDSTGASVLLGYQWHTPGYYASLALGVDVIENTEDPDTGARNNGTHTGYILQAGFQTKSVDALFFQGYGAYLSANERLYTQLRSGWASEKMTFGLEAIYADERDSAETVRYGLFVSDLPLGNGSFGISAGYHDDRGSDDDGAYIAFEYSIPLSLR
ncbi:cellulose biosynthesis protein BcsS [Salipiger sp. P9]|uniref:cellulose biosynthesis protein BcsS n=1 Tax=Salipiger pentaromativorans TaxID=2943193 RepID=UPI0021573059|nr:cellulose biosynthesis protein BcsS [Salipiger pentaromativorans]MCR8548666.1 cellulose biosynthesis protein BcsS [Salipiger pentaromativorans]